MSKQNNRELLELAAKAAGLQYVKPLPEYDGNLGLEVGSDNPMRCRTWNPLTSDGDALRLAVKLKLAIDTDYSNGAAVGSAYLSMDDFYEDDPPLRFGADRNAATRRAIVRAAAAIAKAEDAV